jgi:hypothetical protein
LNIPPPSPDAPLTELALNVQFITIGDALSSPNPPPLPTAELPANVQ